MSCWFNDIDDPESWIPEDSLDINEWIGVTIGDEVGGSDFQVHICTPISIRGIQEKRAIFMLDEYCGLNDLIPKLACAIASTSASQRNSFAAVFSKTRTIFGEKCVEPGHLPRSRKPKWLGGSVSPRSISARRRDAEIQLSLSMLRTRHFLRCGSSPKSDRRVVPGGCDGVSVGRKSHREHVAAVPF